jgi:formylglycine-generating enzyme required for sulfatase activity
VPLNPPNSVKRIAEQIGGSALPSVGLHMSDHRETSRSDLPPFIATQQMRLLDETVRPERFLRAELFRSGPTPGAGLRTVEETGRWTPVDRRDVAHNRLRNADGPATPLDRLVLTTDAGIGKTANLQWLRAELNSPDSDSVAFLLDVARLPRRADDLSAETLLPQLRGAHHNLTDAAGRQILQRLRDEGRLVLLLDALDQAPAESFAIETFCELLRDPAWQGCRFILSGRPYAIQRHWTRLFDTGLGFGWRFVQVDTFDPGQQRRFLGRDEDGKSRYDRVPAVAREILGAPRVLEYLRKLPGGELGSIETASDIYWRAINHMLREGMKNSPPARRLGLAGGEPPPPKVQQRSLFAARRLLGAMAFEMPSTPLVRPPSDDDAPEESPPAPNFDRIASSEMPAFKQRLFARLAAGPVPVEPRDVDRDLDSLAALNEFLQQDLFEPDVEGLDQVLWRNRTLQEFFTAHWIAQHGTPDDADRLWDWIYLPPVPRTEEYYWVWRFTCEMPADARRPEAWTRGMAPLFRPGDSTAEGTRRSCEMIYRAWQPLSELAEEGHREARDARQGFLGELEQVILAGHRGPEAQETAGQFCESLLRVEGGEFHMGSPEEKQGIGEDTKAWWKDWLDREGTPEERAEAFTDGYSFPPTKQGQEMRDSFKQRIMRVFASGDLDAVSDEFYPHNETPEKAVCKIDSFLLGRCPTTNAWYRLFDPGHGVRDSYYRDQYARISPDSDHPAIYITWYDAWVFCLWATWEGRGCRLPHEDEWEYAAKAGTPWDWNYWWGDEFDEGKCNADRRVGRTTPADPAHANPWGFEDILGNVWEWCEDRYRRAYTRDKPPDSSARVLRGGSWGLDTSVVRSAFRIHGPPSFSHNLRGFRVARAK